MNIDPQREGAFPENWQENHDAILQGKPKMQSAIHQRLNSELWCNQIAVNVIRKRKARVRNILATAAVLLIALTAGLSNMYNSGSPAEIAEMENEAIEWTPLDSWIDESMDMRLTSFTY